MPRLFDMMKKIVDCLYQGGTRSPRVVNAAISSIWVFGIFLDSTGLIPMGLHPVADMLGIVFTMFSLSALTSLLSFLDWRFAKTMKYLSLHLGACSHALVIVGLLGIYPPLEITTITSTTFAFWLLGAAYYDLDHVNFQDSEERRKNRKELVQKIHQKRKGKARRRHA